MRTSDVDPMQSAHDALRCHAKAKRTGQPCKAPAVRGWRVCRMHGARGGPPRGRAHPNYRHGGRSKDVVDLRMKVNALVRSAQNVVGR